MVRNSTRSHDRLVPRSLPAPATSSPSSASDDDNPVISVLPFSPPVRTVPADKFYNKASSSRSKLKTYGKHTVNPRNLYRLSKDDHESPSVRRVQPHRPKRDEPKLLGLKPTDFGISTSAIKLHDPPWYTEESDSPDDTLSPAKHEPRKEKQTQLRWDTPTPKKECRTLCEPVECPFCWAPYVRVEKLWETDAFVEHMRFVHKNIVTEGNQKYQEAWDAIALLEYDREFHEQLIGIEMMEARERAKKEWAETTMKRPAANATMPSAEDMVQFGDAAVDFAAMIADVDNMQMENEDIVMLESNSDDEVWDIWVVNKNLGGHDTTEISEKKEENEDNSMLKLDTCENVLKRVIDDAEKFPGKRLCEGLDIDAA